MKTFTSLGAIVAILAATAKGQLVGYATLNGGTTGGGSAAPVTASDCATLKAAVTGTAAAVVKISTPISGCGVIDIGSNKSILGVGSNAGLLTSGFRIKQGKNVIIRNLKLTPPKKGDALALDRSTNVWIDHVDFQSLGLVGGKDDYDGLLDITHASDYVTVSWCKFTNHWKGSLVGHSDSNASEDTGKLHVTYHHNYWYNVNSRTPSIRFGTGHIFNSYYDSIPTSGINSRMGAKVLVEGNVFNNVKLAVVTNLDSDEPGYAVEKNNLFQGTTTTQITQTSAFTPPYSYSLDSAANVQSIVAAGAGVGIVTF